VAQARRGADETSNPKLSKCARNSRCRARLSTRRCRLRSHGDPDFKLLRQRANHGLVNPIWWGRSEYSARVRQPGRYSRRSSQLVRDDDQADEPGYASTSHSSHNGVTLQSTGSSATALVLGGQRI